MKVTKLILLLLCCAAILCSAGCNESLTFRVVDAYTPKPIPHALTVIDAEDLSYLSYVDEVRNGGGTDESGSITLSSIKTGQGWRTSIVFDAIGYYQSGFSAQVQGWKIVERVPKSANPSGQIEAGLPNQSNHIVTIKMYPSSSDTANRKLFRWTNNPHQLFDNDGS